MFIMAERRAVPREKVNRVVRRAIEVGERKARKEVHEFFSLADAINSEADLNLVFQRAADHFAKRFKATAIIAKPNGGPVLKLAAFAGKDIVPAHILANFRDIPYGRGLIGQVAATMEPIEVPNLLEWEHSVNTEIDRRYGFKRSMAVPLTTKGADGKPVLVGVIGLFKKGEHADEEFQPHEKRMVGVLAGNIAIAIHNSSLVSQLKRMAEEDFLTGLHNRRVLFTRMRDHLNSNPPGSAEFIPSLERKRMSIFFLDANSLKLLNDLHGHEAGNQGLKLIADSLRKHAPRDWTIARIGGDEFAAFAPDVDIPKSEEYLAKVKAEIAESIAAHPLAKQMKEAGFGVAGDYSHFGAGGTTKGNYYNLFELLPHAEQFTTQAEHDAFFALLQLPASQVEKAKLGRNQLHAHVPTMVDDMAQKVVSGELTAEEGSKFAGLLANHAGPFVHSLYQGALEKARGKK